jgi:hypothetical protein
MLVNCAGRKPELAILLANSSFIFCIEFMANAAVVYVQPQAYHFRMTQCAWETHAVSFLAKHRIDRMPQFSN